MRLPLHDLHRAAGARIIERFGWEIPADFGDSAQETAVVRHDAGLTDRSDRGKILVSGPDRTAFLQALVTNDVTTIAAGHGLQALGLNHKGQIVADFLILPWRGRLVLVVEPGERAFSFAWLRRHKLRAKVELIDETESLGLLSLAGPKAPTVLAGLLGQRFELGRDEVIDREFAGMPLLIAGSRDLGVTGFDLFLPREKLGEAWQALIDSGARPVGALAWETLRIEAGTPRYGAELGESTLPAEARIEGRAIDPEKGCYPGQEIVARIRNRGQVNRFLRGIILEGGAPPAPAATIEVSGKSVGTVTSAAHSPALGKPIALAFLRREVQPGETVRLADGRSALVVDPPFPSVLEEMG
ncbi:MAG: aminomethyltransferase family protein [Dehalococcoidia bacterium]